MNSCEEGICNCKSGYFGDACESKGCLNDCTSGDHGVCDTVFGHCTCHEGWTGADCSSKSCPLDCSDKGMCVKGSCFCPMGSAGPGCEALYCGNQCIHGKHSEASCVCQCEPGWRGEACGTRDPRPCNVMGFHGQPQRTSSYCDGRCDTTRGYAEPQRLTLTLTLTLTRAT